VTGLKSPAHRTSYWSAQAYERDPRHPCSGLEPSLNITILETLEDCRLESSQAWNNAGTDHAANCELNYTSARAGRRHLRALKVSTGSIYRASCGPT
jgi:hypothetical protein